MGQISALVFELECLADECNCQWVKFIEVANTLATKKSDIIPFPPSNSRPSATVSLALNVIHDCILDNK